MADQIAELRDLMVQQFREVRADQARMEDFLSRHFARIEVRFTGVEDRLTGVEGRLTGVEGRLTGVEGRLTGVEGRLARVEVIQEEMRSDFRAFGESLSHVNRRLEALES